MRRWIASPRRTRPGHRCQQGGGAGAGAAYLCGALEVRQEQVQEHVDRRRRTGERGHHWVAVSTWRGGWGEAPTCTADRRARSGRQLGKVHHQAETEDEQVDRQQALLLVERARERRKARLDQHDQTADHRRVCELLAHTRAVVGNVDVEAKQQHNNGRDVSCTLPARNGREESSQGGQILAGNVRLERAVATHRVRLKRGNRQL